MIPPRRPRDGTASHDGTASSAVSYAWSGWAHWPSRAPARGGGVAVEWRTAETVNSLPHYFLTPLVPCPVNSLSNEFPGR